MEMANSVDAYILEHPRWSKELSVLREICLKTDLEETVKWGMPTYTLKNKNVVGISGFKDHFGIWFFQGVFLKDKLNILLNAQEGKTKAMRQLRFTSVEEIDESVVLSYLEEAIENQKAGKEVKINRKKPLLIPPLIQQALKQDNKLQQAFDNLTLTRQREFSEYIESAKREETKITRLKKILPMIIEGKGLNDKYR